LIQLVLSQRSTFPESDFEFYSLLQNFIINRHAISHLFVVVEKPEKVREFNFFITNEWKLYVAVQLMEIHLEMAIKNGLYFCDQSQGSNQCRKQFLEQTCQRKLKLLSKSLDFSLRK